MSSLLPNGKQRFVDNNGRPLIGGRVYYYIPNTSTPKDTWQDESMTVLNTNPIVLDARGECTAWGYGSYRQVVRDVIGNLIWDKIVTDFTQKIDAAVDGVLSDLLAPAGAGKVGFSHDQTYPDGTLGQAADRFVDVKDAPFLGKGLGESTKAEDRIAVQAALDYAASKGLKCLISDGIWDINNLNCPNNTWLELSSDAWIKPTDHSASGSIVSNVTVEPKARENILIVNPQIDGSLLDYTGLGQDNGIGFATGVKHIRIYGGHIKGFIANLARGPGGKGVGFEEGVEDVIVDGTTIEDCTYPTFVSPTLGDPAKYVRNIQFTNLVINRCACVGWALTDWGTETIPTADPNMFSAMWSDIQASSVGHFPDWARTTGRIQKTGAFVAHGASNITLKNVKIWNPIGYPSATYPAGGTQFPNGYPGIGESYIGAGLSGPIGAVFQGWGRNLNIEIEYQGDCDSIIDYSFPRPHGVQAFASSIKPVSAFDNDIRIISRGSSGRVVRSGYIQNSGTLVAGGSTSVVLAATASLNDGEYAGQTLTITGGTGSGQSRRIIQYIGSSQTATVDSAFSPAPDATSTYTATGSTTAVEDLQVNGLMTIHPDTPSLSVVDPSMRFPSTFVLDTRNPTGVKLEGPLTDIFSRANSFGGGSTTRSGTWTPTIVNGVNVTASTAFLCNFTRVDNVIMFAGRLDINPTAAGTAASLQITVPIPVPFSSSTQAAGVLSDVRGDSGPIFGDITTQRLVFQFLPSATGNRLFSFSGSYRF